MKTFIVNVYKNKKWITLGLSILYLVLFCFPLMTIVKSYDEETAKLTFGELPFILYLAQFILQLPTNIKNVSHPPTNDFARIKLVKEFSVNLTCSILMFACFVLAIISIVRLFKGKKFYFISSLALAFITMLISGISLTFYSHQGVEEIQRTLKFYPTTAIFLILLILDIVYLILEWYYVHDGQEKLSIQIAERKAVKQARQDAELKQSPEYRIEQLEKELQELKAKNNDKDGQ